jgi:hypothetical protein
MTDASHTPPEPVVLREQDEKLIQACCRYQWMTVVDFWYWLGSVLGKPRSRNHVSKVVSRLAGGKDGTPGQYLYKFALLKTTTGNALRVFVPGEATRKLLHEEEDENAFVFTTPATMQRRSYSFVRHNLAVTRLCICAALVCRDPHYSLVETRLSSDIARTPPRVSLTTDGKPISVPVIPDCWLFIERVADGKGTALWFELDNSTTYRQAFHRRLAARLQIITSEAYCSYFGTPAVLLCYAVLDNEDRMHTLRHWTWELLTRQEREHLATHFRFASVEYETLYREALTLFMQPVWRLPADRSHDDPALVALLPPPQDKEEAHGNSQTTDLS